MLTAMAVSATVIVLIVLLLGAFTSIGYCFVTSMRMVANRKPGVPLMPRPSTLSFWFLYSPDQLAGEGLLARRRWITAFSVGFVCTSLSIATMFFLLRLCRNESTTGSNT